MLAMCALCASILRSRVTTSASLVAEAWQWPVQHQGRKTPSLDRHGGEGCDGGPPKRRLQQCQQSARISRHTACGPALDKRTGIGVFGAAETSLFRCSAAPRTCGLWCRGECTRWQSVKGVQQAAQPEQRSP